MFEVRVPEYTEMKVSEEGLETYTAYTVSVKHIASNKVWTLNKRYSDFEALYNALLAGKHYQKALEAYNFPSKYTFNSKSDFTKVRRKNEFDDFMKILAEVEVLPSIVEDFLSIKVHLVPSRRYTPSPHVLKVSAVQAASSIDDITVSDEDNAIHKVMKALPGLLMINTILTLVGYIAALYFGVVEADTTTPFRKVVTCISVIVTVTFIRAILKKREWELQAALAKREKKKDK